ncbi:MAG: T9SS type A sorting domain-containing protein [Bacteroidales bacterium]|nr:T9SS type A sorting domain-containing protein [Bacteroidales bacterium]
MKRILLIAFLVLLCLQIFAQTVTLTFTASDTNDHYVQLDRVVVNNITEGWQETIYWPDTVLTLQAGSGIGAVETREHASLQLSQNTPNPFHGTTFATLMLPESGDVLVETTDIGGRVVETYGRASLQEGTHQLRVTLSTAGVYFLTARMNGQSSSIKMVNQGDGGKDEVVITSDEERQHSVSVSPKQGSAVKGISVNPFHLGDQMMYVGYTTVNGEELGSFSVEQVPEVSQTVMLRFVVSPTTTDGQPCPGAPTVTDIDGNVYNTVQLGNQCWMRENLRTTRFANGDSILIDPNPVPIYGWEDTNPNPYRYTPNNDSSVVSVYGYLYNWSALMCGDSCSYAVPSGVQGICPDGWHVPSFYEWEELRICVTEQNAFICGDTNINVGKSLAAADYWDLCEEACCVGNNQSSNNATGFSACPAGIYHNGTWSEFGQHACFASTSDRWDWIMSYDLYYDKVYVRVFLHPKNDGLSVRCIRD